MFQFRHLASVGYHFATYHSYPTYYTPFPGYSPVSSFGLGLALGSSLGHHHHYHDYYDRPSTSYHYHSTTYNNNNGGGSTVSSGGGGTNPNANNNGNTGNNGNTANGNIPNSNIYNSAPNGNFNSRNANNLNNNPNQNGTFNEPTFGQSTAPLVYSISGKSKSDDADSTEIIFTNPYLIVGVENMLLYAEFQDEQDIFIFMEQDSDGLEPYPWNRWYPTLVEQNATSSTNETTQIPNAEQTTIAIDITTEINTTTQQTMADSTTKVPLAPLPAMT